MALTPKQEKFCQCIVSGMSGKESYQTAYNSTSDNSAMIESTKLLARDDIQEKITALRKPLETVAQTQAISEREKKRAVLWDIIQSGDDNAKCRALDILNKMDMEYININKNIEIDTSTLDDMPQDALNRLISGSLD